MTEELSVFKSYLRRLLHDLKTLKSSLESGVESYEIPKEPQLLRYLLKQE